MKARTYKPESEVPFWKELKKSRPYLTKQQYCTLKVAGVRWTPLSRRLRSKDRGDSRDQAVKRKVRDARKGLQKILYRRNG